jgi:signal transduction histidine kinase
MIRDAGRGLTGLIRELRPVELEGKGIAAALRTHAARWASDTGIRTEVRVRGERPTPLRLEQELFRVAQEALNNVARHSRADRVDLQLSWNADRLRFTVTDNGRGFPAGALPPIGPGAGSGIRNMRERMASVGGTLEIEGSGPGTRVIASVPLDRSPEAAEAEPLSLHGFETPSKG